MLAYRSSTSALRGSLLALRGLSRQVGTFSNLRGSLLAQSPTALLLHTQHQPASPASDSWSGAPLQRHSLLLVRGFMKTAQCQGTLKSTTGGGKAAPRGDEEAEEAAGTPAKPVMVASVSESESARRENIVTVPNFLSLSRLVMAPFIGYFVLVGNFQYALAGFVVAGVTDFLDGTIARAFNQRTIFGTVLDPMADKVLMATMTVTLAYIGKIRTLREREMRLEVLFSILFSFFLLFLFYLLSVLSSFSFHFISFLSSSSNRFASSSLGHSDLRS